MTRRKNRTRKERNEQTAREYFLEQAAAYFDDVKATAHDAPYGQFLNVADAIALSKGRELIQLALESVTQEAIDEIEKKNATRLCPKCQTKKRHQGYRNKEIVAASGTINLERRYDKCLPCDLPEHVADERLGLESRYTVGLRRLAVRAGGSGAFAQAEDDLEEYTGLKLSHMTIRELCQQEAPKMAEWQASSSEVQEDFIESLDTGPSPVVVEVTMDGTCVNTMEGYKDTKIGIYSTRPLGESALPEEWNTRKLPRPLSCVAFAAVEGKDDFQERCQDWRRRLQVGSKGDISTLGDGAPWIWNISRAVFGKTRENLDVFHGLEHLMDTGKVLYKEGSAEYETWKEETKREFLESGFEQIEKRLDALALTVKPSESAQKEALRLLRGYLENNRERLNYRERLAEGRAIGSGQVEGACKSMIGKRLKQSGAKWQVPRLNRMITICSIRYSSHWKLYWERAKKC